jgi:anthranilate phosphoribosyltransferase
MNNEQSLRDFGQLICAIAMGKEMTREETCDAYKQVILNQQPELQQGAFLAAHFCRKPTTIELAGAWDALDLFDTAKIDVNIDGPICDIVGTGSDQLKTVNCSTPAAFIAAACGLPIAKKGARLVTGVSGASDIFQQLGIDLELPLAKAETALQQIGLCYLPGEAFLKAGWGRLIQNMRFTSAFNIIGPLTRPCEKTNRIVIGAYAPEVCDQLIEVLKQIEMPAALAPYGMVKGQDNNKGIDEFSLSGITRVVELRNGIIDIYEVTPTDFGIKWQDFSTIASASTAQGNCTAILRVLKGEYDTPLADFFAINAAAALYISDIAPTYKKATEMAKEALATGKAYEKLEQLLAIQCK